MTRDIRSLRRLLRAQELKTRASEAELGTLKIRLAELHAEEEACHAVLQNETLSIGMVTRSVTKRLTGLAARKENITRRIGEAEEKVKLETLRAEKVGEWLDVAEERMEEERLSEVAQDDVANKIHASG